MKGRRPRDRAHFPALNFFWWTSQSHSAVRWLYVILSWTGFGGGIVSLKQIFINWLNLITCQCVVCVKSHPHQVIRETVAVQDKQCQGRVWLDTVQTQNKATPSQKTWREAFLRWYDRMEPGEALASCVGPACSKPPCSLFLHSGKERIAPWPVWGTLAFI